MSKYDVNYLRENIRVGFTTADGPAWWAGENHMTDGTHFAGAVPLDEIRKILSVPLVEAKVQGIYTGASGESLIATNSNMKGVVRQDTGHLIKVFSAGYQIHAYEEWLLNKVSRVLDTHRADLSAKSVGLLKYGAQAWLQIKLNDSFEVNGFGFVPFLTAATSADGSLLSQFTLGFDAAVCDNTLSMALVNAIRKAGRKHTKNSTNAETDKALREELGILFTAADDFSEAAAMLMDIPVSEAQWNTVLDELVPVPEIKEGARGGRGNTIAMNKRAELNDLYFTDAKAAPWNGTAFGAFQTFNTWQTWHGVVRGADGGRMERFHSNMIDGTTESRDSEVLKVLAKVTGRELITA